MTLSTFATDICVRRRHARLGNAVLLAMAVAAPVAAQQPEPSPPTIYGFSLGYAPSGAIVTARDSVNGNWSYTYDPVNRLATADRSGPALTFDYDRNGNRWRQTPLDGQGPLPQYDFDTRSNHIVGMTYDALGNIRNDALHTYTYDAENRLIKVDEGTTAEYTYDALGRRVRKASANGAATEYLYDLAGRVAAERDGSTGGWNRAEVYAGGRHVATYARDTTYFHHQDWLGSNRVTTLPDGSLAEQCTNLPFGDRQICLEASGQSATATPFADYERDRETNLDHTWFRQYSSTQGRWTTPDPYLGSMDLTNPQSLNRYAYVNNSPTNLVDPLGLGHTEIFRDGDCYYMQVFTSTWNEKTSTLDEERQTYFLYCDAPPRKSGGGGGGGSAGPRGGQLAAGCFLLPSTSFAGRVGAFAGGADIGKSLANGEPPTPWGWISIFAALRTDFTVTTRLTPIGILVGHEVEAFRLDLTAPLRPPLGAPPRAVTRLWTAKVGLTLGEWMANSVEQGHPGCGARGDCPATACGLPGRQ